MVHRFRRMRSPQFPIPSALPLEPRSNIFQIRLINFMAHPQGHDVAAEMHKPF
jgi:hypothetical protein